MFIPQRRPKWMLFAVVLCYFCFRTKLFPSLAAELVTPPDILVVCQTAVISVHGPCIKTSVPSVSFIESTDLLQQHLLLRGVTCLSVEVIAACVMPPTWHMRLVSASAAAMPISSTETEGDGSPPTDTRANTTQTCI